MNLTAIRLKFVATVVAIAAMVDGASSVRGQGYPNDRIGQQRGATLGGLAGAVAGGIIGDNSGEAGAGAAIGGVLGAVAGGFLGNASDREAELQARRQAYAAANRQAAVVQSAVNFNDVIQMSRSGLSDNVIIGQIQSRGVVASPLVSDIIAMHGQGVSENVITAMQRGVGGAAAPAVAPAPTPYVAAPPSVIVQEHHYVPHYRPVPVYRAYPPRGYHSRIHIGL